MEMCFLNNVYCCYLPAHCSHGLQPLDNGIFNAIKAAYRKQLEYLASLTDSAPVDKINFIKALAKAREIGFTAKNILAGWRVTGNWPISRHKALSHPELQQEPRQATPQPVPEFPDSDNTPTTARQVRDLAIDGSPRKRRRYSKIAKGFGALEATVAIQTARVTALEGEVAQLKKSRKRKAVPNPNRRFMEMGELLAGGEAIPDVIEVAQADVVDQGLSEAEGSAIVVASGDDSSDEILATSVHTRSGRAIKKPRKLLD
jgi:DDE superfamily endonuclease